MSHNMYTALSGAVAEERNLEILSDNMANARTPGFKAERLTFSSLLAAQEGVDGANTSRVQVQVAGSQNDWTQGNMKATGRPLDVALRGPGFFSVQTDQGERLTRQGNFIHSADGALRTQVGHQVMGESGPINARPDLALTIDKNGAVFSGGSFVDTLKRVEAPVLSELTREGNSLWRPENAANLRDVGTLIEVGSLEMSNVNPVNALTQMISTQRHYEMYHRAIENGRNIQQKAAQELG